MTINEPDPDVLWPSDIHYLGMTSYFHELDWIKFAAGVPGYDDQITAVVFSAIKPGIELTPEHEALRRIK